MATYTTNLIGVASYYASDTGEISTKMGAAWTGNVGSITYYKCRATSSTATSGFITWINTTGDTTNQPTGSGTVGPTHIVATWLV